MMGLDKARIRWARKVRRKIRSTTPATLPVS